ncbi:hypothetical protein MSG28_001864 [Choristoneura fumiferana]|uniref:Uncharacterized protein n=1 Tax=Choristoneura fumiferana TaxID=7141 RepID=A0ACC0KWH6_CHOFU|nr:hypothetical protein MSG28_001864 [Choristoneura fumiferana]
MEMMPILVSSTNSNNRIAKLTFNFKIHRKVTFSRRFHKLNRATLTANYDQFNIELRNRFEDLNTDVNDVDIKYINILESIRGNNTNLVKTALVNITSLRAAKQRILEGKHWITNMRDGNGNKHSNRQKILQICTDFYKSLYSPSKNYNLEDSFCADNISPFTENEYIVSEWYQTRELRVSVFVRARIRDRRRGNEDASTERGSGVSGMYESTCGAAASGQCGAAQRDDAAAAPARAEPAARDYSGFDIVKATQYGAFDRVRELVEAGWDVNQPDHETVTLLHWAAINNRREICAYLLARGAAVDAVGGELRATPLHWAARQGHLEAAVLLVRAGADLARRDAEGCAALHLAAQFGHTAVCAYLVAAGGAGAADAGDAGGMTPLMWAAWRVAGVDPARLLLSLGADPRPADAAHGNTALHWAILARNSTAVSTLVLYGNAPLDVPNLRGATPLGMLQAAAGGGGGPAGAAGGPRGRRPLDRHQGDGARARPRAALDAAPPAATLALRQDRGRINS